MSAPGGAPPTPDPRESDIDPQPPPTPGQALHELTRLLHELAVSMARVEGKLDSVAGTSTDHEARLRALEAAAPTEHGRLIEALSAQIASLQRWRWLVTGAAAAAGAGSSAAITAVLGR